ncbi:MAG: TIGR03118 family protein [Terriglobia bacterium]
MRHFNHAMVALGGLALLASLPTAAWAGPYQQKNLVTNNTDPNLINPWGISFGPNTPFWVSDNGTQKATLYTGAGVPQALVVNIPPSGTSGPTGQVFNNSGLQTGFIIPSDASPALFIFANLNGTISAWNGGLGMAPGVTAQVVGQPPPGGATFTGLALANNTLYAADNGSNANIVSYNSNFVPTTRFTDLNPSVAGLTPYNIQSLPTSNGQLYVTFENKTPGTSGGAVEILTSNGTFLPLISSITTPSLTNILSQPWGLALAPASFGPFGGDLLVGNKGNGTIDAFTTAGVFVGQLTLANGSTFMEPGLWGLAFGNAGPGFDPNTLYFTAGISQGPGDNIYTAGLFGSISVVPEPASAILLGLGMIVLCGVCHWGSRQRQRGSAPGKEGAIHVP